MSAGRICVRTVDLAEPEEPVWVAAERMHQRGVGTLIVLGKDGQPAGILTDRDLVTRVLAKGLSAHDTRVRDVMSSPVVKADERTDIDAALSLMRSHAIRRVVIVNAEEELVGVLSLDDVLMLMAEEFQAIGALVEKETPAGAMCGRTP
jgi:CBS domain-containing protein